jgi:hypothetical protein
MSANQRRAAPAAPTRHRIRQNRINQPPAHTAHAQRGRPKSPTHQPQHTYATASIAAKVMKKGEISSKGGMKSHLACVAGRGSAICAWAFLDQESAMDRAAQRDA